MPPLALSLSSWLEIAQLMSRRVHKDPARAQFRWTNLMPVFRPMTIVKATVFASTMTTAKVNQTARESHFRRPSMNASTTTRAIHAAFMRVKMPSALTFAQRMQSAEESAGVIQRRDIATDMRIVNSLPKRNHGSFLRVFQARF